ncbi:hypothetical protein HanHA89_Chr01g0013141 [Helianthus annuus]|nr:hypothetical protein HanHA89_Chr01g0013141 [Helianthus annuus]
MVISDIKHRSLIFKYDFHFQLFIIHSKLNTSLSSIAFSSNIKHLLFNLQKQILNQHTQ